MPFVLTKEHLKNATTYMPLRTKTEIGKQIALSCLEDIDTDEQNKIGEALIALPHLKGENLAMKSILLTNTLLGFYLNIDLRTKKEDGTDADIYEVYDYCAGGHLLNQLERFKSDPEVKDIAFDLLSDFKEFKKIVDTELYNAKANANDPIPRFSAAVSVLTTPESLKSIIEEIKSLAEQREEKKDALVEALKRNTAERLRKEAENGNKS